MNFIPFSQLHNDDLKRLAELHCAAMRTLLADLGLPIVSRYYQIARADLSVIGLCARDSTGEIVGWAMGSPYPDRINARLRSPLIWFALQTLRVLFTRPLTMRQLITSMISSSSAMTMKSDSIELTYIGVAARERGRGLGGKLLNAFIEASRAKGFRSVVLSVEVENESAVALYERAGFKIVKTFSEGRYQRHRMELSLA